jgi:hypothetical protein
MKRFFFPIIMSVVMIFAIGAPANARHHHKSIDYVTKSEFNTVQMGWTKYHVENVFGQEGHRTLTWGDDTWIQKQYVGKPIPDEFLGTETTAFLNYEWDGEYWRLQFKTWCVWNNLNAWDCT